MRLITDQDATTEGTPTITGNTGTPDPVTGAPVPSGPIITKRITTVQWQHQEPQPAGSLQGFEVAIYSGDDPDNSASYIQAPVTLGPNERSLQVALQLRSQQTVKAAVRALYPDGYKSAWASASAGAVFVPDTQAYGSSGSLKLPDGTIMQWVRTDAFTAEGKYSVKFPATFPNRVYSVQLTEENPGGTIYDDALYQLVSMDQAGCVIFKQIVSNATTQPSRCNVLAFGY